jgi:hypothetical protein
VGGGGVDHAGGVRLDQRHRLASGVVGQAQDGHVRAVQRVATGVDILADRVGQADERQVAAALQALADLQTRGAGLPVDEHLVHV